MTRIKWHRPRTEKDKIKSNATQFSRLPRTFLEHNFAHISTFSHFQYGNLNRYIMCRPKWWIIRQEIEPYITRSQYDEIHTNTECKGFLFDLLPLPLKLFPLLLRSREIKVGNINGFPEHFYLPWIGIFSN